MPTTNIDLFALVQDHLGTTLDVGNLDTRTLSEVATDAQDLIDDRAVGYSHDDLLHLGSIVEAIRAIKNEMDGQEFEDGVELIRDNCFREHAEQLAEDLGAIDSDAKWPMNCIDWEHAADELKHDYSAVEIAGSTYWFRG